MKTRTQDRLLGQIVKPLSSSLDEKAARKLIDVKIDRKTRTRVAKLAQKCNEGELTAEERSEYEWYVMVNRFVGMLQAKARILLARKDRAT